MLGTFNEVQHGPFLIKIKLKRPKYLSVETFNNGVTFTLEAKIGATVKETTNKLLDQMKIMLDCHPDFRS